MTSSAASGSVADHLFTEIQSLRSKATEIPMINPPLIAAERLTRDFGRGDIDLNDIEAALDQFARNAIRQRADNGAAYLRSDTLQQTRKNAGDDIAFQIKTLCQAYLQQNHRDAYGLVFTAHPIFALSVQDSEALAHCILNPKSTTPVVQPLSSITLSEEHTRAMTALDHVRQALLQLNRTLYDTAAEMDKNLNTLQPFAFSMATWVGYDLDGRDDIQWYHSFRFRLLEKQMIIAYYRGRLRTLQQEFPPCRNQAQNWLTILEAEHQALQDDIALFDQFIAGSTELEVLANRLSERDKLVDAESLAKHILDQATAHTNATLRREWWLLGQEIRLYCFGMGRIHLRLNAVQIRNAMRNIDGQVLSRGRTLTSERLLRATITQNMQNMTPEAVNFANLHYEASTASRLMMLAKQIIKHIDCCQPIRLLIAECERPITLLSALYQAKLVGVDDMLDISPLFETQLALERGNEIIDDVLATDSYRDYVHRRQTLAIQMGFSDAGRFVGQLPASLAIERLQIKLADVHQKHCHQSVKLLMFNTHGESLGRGGARGKVDGIRQRQHHIFSTYARRYCKKAGISVIHESSFQGGDGYLWFQNADIAQITLLRLCAVELTADMTAAEQEDPFYNHHTFSLDLFLNIKRWQETLFHNPDYGALLGIFGTHTLPKAGSRPSKRASSSMDGRQDPSKIRAIAHNGLLQQYGYLVNVAGGLGHASQIDPERMVSMYQASLRLRSLVDHALLALRMGSINALLAYASVLDRGSWIGRAYQAQNEDYVHSCRLLADLLIDDTRADALKRLAAIFRDDMLDLNLLLHDLDMPNIAPIGNLRLLLDSLQALRLFLIMQTMMTICALPRFAEHNATRREDVIRMVLTLDVPAALEIIRQEFNLNENRAKTHQAVIESGRSVRASDRYQQIKTDVVEPINRMYAMIKRISLLIGCIYGGHG